MSSLTRATESMSLDELLDVLQEHKANYRNLRESIYYMKRQVDNATVRRDQRRVGVLITAGMYNDGITVNKTLAYLAELENILERKCRAISNEIQRLSVLKNEVSQKCRIARTLLEMIERGETPQAIESKMSRDYSGDHKWKGIIGTHDLMPITLYFKNLDVMLIKNQAISTLKRIIETVEPDDGKAKGVYNLKAIEEKLEETFDEFAGIGVMRLEVYKLTQATERLRDILNSISQ